METTGIFEKLKSLQVILGRKYELEAKIEEAPKQLGTQDELLAKLKKEFIEKSKSYENVKTVVLGLRAELDEAVRTREAGEKNMDNITTHREYEALEKQINEASAKEADVRKQLQKEEKNLSELNDSIKGTEAMISAQETDLNSSKSALNNQLDAYKSELESLKKEEEAINPGLDQEILFKFQRIIQRNAEGIVAIRNGVCTGCHMILPAQFANEVHEGDSILFCPYCSRILYYEEGESEEQESFFNDAGSLVDLDDDFVDDDFADDEDNDDLYDSEENEGLDDESLEDDSDDSDEDSEE